MHRKFLILLFFIAPMAILAQQMVLSGKASFYHDKFEGRLTANGEIFTQSKLTAAHKTLPFGTVVKVTNLENDKSVIVTVNDRGPFVSGRIIDLSKSAAKKLEFVQAGVAEVAIEIMKEDALLPQKSKSPPDNKKTTNSIPTSAHTFYTLESKPSDPKGFAVQLGSFKESTNLIRLVNKLQNTFRKKITIQIKTIQPGVDIYSVLVGSFDKRKRADKFKEKVIKEYSGSFVVDFSEINPTSD